MNATKTTMIPVISITINQAEGMHGQMLKGAHTTWEAANKMLASIKHSAPKDGSYYKTDVIVIWADGMQVSTREDVANSDRYLANLATNIRSTWLFYAGLKKPDHLTEEQYDRITSDIARRDAAVAYLKKYDLNDGTSIVKTTVAEIEHRLLTKDGINKAIERVAALLASVESPEMKNGAMTPIAIRASSMELRKAIAALIRARDVM